MFLSVLFACSKENVDNLNKLDRDVPPFLIEVLEKSEEPLLVGDKPWETYTIGYSMVLNVRGKYEMWYEAFSLETSRDDFGSYLCYAYSDDGVNWIKPELGKVSYNGSFSNNILFDGKAVNGIHGPFVYFDRGVFFLVVNQIVRNQGSPQYLISIAESIDGINWSPFEPILEYYSDTQNSLIKYRNRLQLFLRSWIGGVIVGERAVARSKSIGNSIKAFEQPSFVFRNSFERDVYSSGAVNFENKVLICFTSKYKKFEDQVDLSLVFSLDGENYFTSIIQPDWKRDDFSWDSRSIYASPSLIKESDSTYFLYYTGSDRRHNQIKTPNDGLRSGVGRYKLKIVHE